MPGIIYRSVSRRKFIHQAAVAASAFSLTRLGMSADGDAKSLRLALLSDTHVPADRAEAYRGFKPWENLQRAAVEVVASNPEGVILNGDAARLTGELADYVEVKKLLRPIAEKAPIYIGLGNHDHRENFFKSIEAIPGKRQDVSGKHVAVIEHPVVRVIVLDSLLYVNKVAGLLGKAQREWIGTYLSETDDRPVVLFIHHTLGDGDGDLLDADRLFRVIAAHPKVKAIFYGHSHVYRFAERQGVQLINLPAIGYNFSDAQPIGWVEASFRSDGVDLTLRALGGNMEGNGKKSSVKWVV